jgi:hypothetical protein
MINKTLIGHSKISKHGGTIVFQGETKVLIDLSLALPTSGIGVPS